MKQFKYVKIEEPGRNAFNLSHERKLTMRFGRLYPTMLMEVIPGDDFRVESEIFLRMLPMVSPVMHQINAYMHYFFVPYRLLWQDWEEFVTGGRLGNALPAPPMFVGNNQQFRAAFGESSLGDYFGLPVENYNVFGQSHPLVSAVPISQLPFRAYSLIWNDYYRDQNLEEERMVPLVGGNQSVHGMPAEIRHLIDIKHRAWEKDYFTSALPWSQRGAVANLPVSGFTEVMGQVEVITPLVDGQISKVGNQMRVAPNTDPVAIRGLSGALSHISAPITLVRRMFAIQRWMEKSARIGSRYIEQILAHFGVKSDDARLQRPEYLGGGRVPIMISEVVQTSQVPNQQTPLGTYAGHGIAADSSIDFRKEFKEHGFVVGILSVLPRTAYSQGIPRIFTKTDKYDYYWPDLAQIGEQPVHGRELFYSGDGGAYNNMIFGWQERYAEYRTQLDTVHGAFRTSLKHWHLAREFQLPPNLNGGFVDATSASDRIFAVQLGQDSIVGQVYNKVQAIRPILEYGTPL